MYLKNQPYLTEITRIFRQTTLVREALASDVNNFLAEPIKLPVFPTDKAGPVEKTSRCETVIDPKQTVKLPILDLVQ